MKVMLHGLFAMDVDQTTTVIISRGNYPQVFDEIPEGYKVEMSEDVQGVKFSKGVLTLTGTMALQLLVSPKFKRIEVTLLTKDDFKTIVGKVQSNPENVQAVLKLINLAKQVIENSPENGELAKWVNFVLNNSPSKAFLELKEALIKTDPSTASFLL